MRYSDVTLVCDDQIQFKAQFMYLGEGRYYYERMRELIKVAKDLEVKEISKGVEIPSEEEEIMQATGVDDEEKKTDGDPEQTSDNMSKGESSLQLSVCS